MSASLRRCRSDRGRTHAGFVREDAAGDAVELAVAADATGGFVDAARASGASGFTIVRVHVLGNVLGPICVDATSLISVCMILASGLSFLGLGIPEPHPSWGRMLSESAAEYVRTAPWLVIFPGIAISLTVFGTNLVSLRLVLFLFFLILSPICEISCVNFFWNLQPEYITLLPNLDKHLGILSGTGEVVL